jgi:hypothetical protein
MSRRLFCLLCAGIVIFPPPSRHRDAHFRQVQRFLLGLSPHLDERIQVPEASGRCLWCGNRFKRRTNDGVRRSGSVAQLAATRLTPLAGAGSPGR